MSDPQLNETITDIKTDLEQFIRDSLSDPDLAAQSDDYRKGYAQGFREAFAVVVARELKRIGTTLVVVVLCVLAAGCNGIQPNPTSPTPATTSAAPTAIQIAIMPAELPIGGGTVELFIATTAGSGTVVAPQVAVRLSVDSGDLSAGDVTTDATGHARVTWAGTKTATLTATTGELTTSARLVVAVPFVPPPPVPPTRPPAPPAPEPLPPQPPAPPVLTVTMTASPQQVLVGQPTTLTAQVSNLAPGETVLAYQWDWDGGTVFAADETSAGNARPHIYTTDGVKTPVVLIQTSAGRTASTTTRVFVVSPLSSGRQP